jgi:hypothetical protein
MALQKQNAILTFIWSHTIRTGCSSSLIALHLACQAIRQNECPAAIVGGSNLILSPTTTIAMSEQGLLSPDGRCKTFDSRADGYVRGEGSDPCLYINFFLSFNHSGLLFKKADTKPCRKKQ